MTDGNALAIQYIDKHQKIVGKSTDAYTFTRMYRVDNKVFIDMKLNKISIATEKDKKDVSKLLLKAIKKGATCKDEETIDYLAKGVILQYEYYDKLGNKIKNSVKKNKLYFS